jgi:glyoxylase-like metal-dependent hydrolase (beta-lactamase superfamily II)
MYILTEKNEALVIDPHIEEDIVGLFKRLGIKDVFIILTHEHPDHISGVYWFQQNYKCTLICSDICAKYLCDKKNTRPILISFVLEQKDSEDATHLLDEFKKEYFITNYKADITFNSTYEWFWHEHLLKFYLLEGHSKGSCIVIIDNKIVLSGDTLLKDYPVITRFPGGNTTKYKEETLPFLNQVLKKDMNILPGHGESFLLNEIIREGKIHVELR